jgi:hypothetical protein
MKTYDLSNEIEQRGVLVGMLLGDGGRTYTNFCIGHSLKQKSYLLFKKDILEKITGKPVHICSVSHTKGEKTYHTMRIYPKQHPLIKELVKTFYCTGKKRVTKELLEMLTVQGLAIWYMDDGSCSAKRDIKGAFRGANINLSTYISMEDNQMIVDYFKKRWGINWYIGKGNRDDNYRLCMGTIEGRSFFNLISDYILPSLSYKIKLPEARYVGYNNKLNPILPSV